MRRGETERGGDMTGGDGCQTETEREVRSLPVSFPEDRMTEQTLVWIKKKRVRTPKQHTTHGRRSDGAVLDGTSATNV